jgi:hypothetical protein
MGIGTAGRECMAGPGSCEHLHQVSEDRKRNIKALAKKKRTELNALLNDAVMVRWPADLVQSVCQLFCSKGMPV